MKKTHKHHGHIVNFDNLPQQYPTHQHSDLFWANLGRAVATFGFLEEVLGKAIFALSATRPYTQDEIDTAYENWLPKLKKAVSDPLHKLIDEYEKAAKEHSQPLLENFADLITDLNNAKKLRNMICHSSWRLPDQSGRSVPFFITPQGERFDQAIDTAYLEQLQRHVAELSCSVVTSITCNGWQFPGSNGPGKPIIV